MKVSQLIPVENICIGWPVKEKPQQPGKWDLIQAGIEFLCSQEGFPEQVLNSATHYVNERERAMTTAIGHGIAIPHASVDSITNPAGACIIIQKGIDFEAIDHELVYVIFLVLLPEKQYKKHIQTLSNIVFLTNHAELRDKLISLNTPSQVWKVIAQLEE